LFVPSLTPDGSPTAVVPFEQATCTVDERAGESQRDATATVVWPLVVIAPLSLRTAGVPIAIRLVDRLVDHDRLRSRRAG
jgi:hypothetical protein